MTVDYTRVAAFDVRNALWAELQAYGLLKASDYIAEGFNVGLVPIVPSQEIPQFNNLLPGVTYLTYDIIQKNSGETWWISEESMVLQIISRSNAQIIAISNFLTDFVRRYEKTAYDLNTYGALTASPFKFLYCRLEAANPVQPFVDEGGFMSGDLSFIYTYTRSVDTGMSNSGRYV